MTLHTYAELCTVKASELVKIPDGLEMTTAATLPLVNITGDQLVRLRAKVQPGQTVLITGALGAVGRSAVFAAAEIGARVIAGVRGKRLEEARQLPGVTEAIAVDDDADIDTLPLLDCVADTLGGEIAGKLIAKSSRAARSAASRQLCKTPRVTRTSRSTPSSRRRMPQPPCITRKPCATAN